jgi:hypothetical protein
MRIALYLLTFLLVACSSPDTSNTRKDTSYSAKLTPLSQWLIENEDSLFRALSAHVKQDTITNKPEYQLINRHYDFAEGILGALADSIKRFSPCLDFDYVFSPEENPYFELLLSPNYDTSCIQPTDLIFSDINQLKNFRIKKYISPGGAFSLYINDKDTVNPTKVRFGFNELANKFDLTIYTDKKITRETQKSLEEQIFGEEVLLKRIRSVKQKRLKDTLKNTKTIEEARHVFSIG